MNKRAKFYRREKNNSHFKPIWAVFLLILIVSTAQISAIITKTFEEDTIKSSELTKYGTITIKEKWWIDVFGWFEKEIKRINLIENTENCGETCYAIKDIELFERGTLIDSIRFETIRNDGLRIKEPIKDYQFYIRGESFNKYVDDYETICEVTGYTANGTEIKSCEDNNVGTHIEKGYEWIPYNYEELEAGNYTLKLIGNKKPTKTIDWIITSQGQEIKEWAIWSGSLYNDLLSFWKMDDSSGELYDEFEMSNLSGAGGYSQAGKIGTSISASGGVRPVTNSVYSGESWSFGGWYTISSPDSKQSLAVVDLDTGIMTDDSSNWYLMASGSKLSSSTPINTSGSFAHIVAVLDSDSSRALLYENNELKINDSFGGSISKSLTQFGFVGISGSSGDPTSMGLDEWGLWNRSLSGEEIDRLYNDFSGLTYIPISVIINSPQNNSIVNGSATFNATTSSSSQLSNTTLWIDERQNETIDITGTSNETIWEKNLSEGTHNWTVFSCNVDGDCTWAEENRTIISDVTPPTISVSYGDEALDYGGTDINHSINFTATDINLDSCWIDYNSTNRSISCLSGVEANYSFKIQPNKFDALVWANDTSGKNTSQQVQWSYKIFETDQYYLSDVVEGSSNKFNISINYESSNWDVITGSIFYNNKEYVGIKSGTGNNVSFSKSITAPTVTSVENKTFNWQLGLTNSSGTFYFNSTSYNQTINLINASICGTPYTIPFVNFTFYDETTLEKINGTIDLTFEYKETDSSEAFTHTLSYSNDSETESSFAFCFDPADKTYSVDAVIEYTASDYTNKFYNFDNVDFSNQTTNISLYLLNSSISTSFIIEVLDTNYQPLVGAEVYVQRYYTGTNTWDTVEILNTNDDGETVQHIFTEDALYRFKIYDDGELLHTTSQSTIACPETPCTVTIILDEEIEDIYEDIGNLDTSLTMNDAYLISYTYSDTSGNFSQARLKVTRSASGEPSLLPTCNTTKSASTGVITCDLATETNGTYIARGYITRVGNSEEIVERSIFVKIRDIISGIGLDGVLWSLFFLIGIVMIGIVRPSLAIMFAIAGMFMLSWLQLMEIEITALVSLLAIGVILLMETRRQ